MLGFKHVFPNGIIPAVVQPGGSKGDESVTAACDARGLPMIFTGRRHFKH